MTFHFRLPLLGTDCLQLPPMALKECSSVGSDYPTPLSMLGSHFNGVQWRSVALSTCQCQSMSDSDSELVVHKLSALRSQSNGTLNWELLAVQLTNAEHKSALIMYFSICGQFNDLSSNCRSPPKSIAENTLWYVLQRSLSEPSDEPHRPYSPASQPNHCDHTYINNSRTVLTASARRQCSPLTQHSSYSSALNSFTRLSTHWRSVSSQDIAHLWGLTALDTAADTRIPLLALTSSTGSQSRSESVIISFEFLV